MPAVTYKIKLEASFGETKVVSKEMSMTVTMMAPELSVKSSDTILFAKDKNDRVVIGVETNDTLLNTVDKIEIKDVKYKDLFEIIDYGDGEFAIGFKDRNVDTSLIGKSITLSLNVYFTGNQTEKANATVKVKITVV